MSASDEHRLMLTQSAKAHWERLLLPPLRVDNPSTQDSTPTAPQALQSNREDFPMSIDNALASVAVKDLNIAAAWYAKLLGAEGKRPMPEVADGPSRAAAASRSTRARNALVIVHSRWWSAIWRSNCER
jgi:hypothetical protein